MHTATNGTALGAGTPDDKFTNTLLLGGSKNCNTLTQSLMGLTITCSNELRSDATISTGFDPAQVFVGKISLDDVASTIDASGIVTYTAVSNRASFENRYRTLGINDSNDYSNATHRARCVAGTCQIWDFSLSKDDTLLLNKSGNGVSTNSTFINGDTCPSEVNGNEVTTAWDGTRIFLTNAYEVMFDNKGNDDGLCDSNEDCIYMPNFGSYQGHGDYTSNECIF